MFTMAKIKDRNTINGLSHKSNYLNSHLINNDYYSENNKVSGKWEGKLAENLGIDQNVISAEDKTFELLKKNLNPKTGEKLTPRNRPGGIRFFDFQCSAQKSVSIMAVTLDDTRLREVHEKAFKTAFTELEKFAACRDNSQPGFILEPKSTGNVAAAVFNHDASRALDPQLHTHCVILNATYDPETGRHVALESRNMVKAIRYAGKVYQNELALGVKSLGYEIENKINAKGIIEGFEIKDIDEKILKQYSKRRSAIEAQIEKFKEKHGRKPTTEEIHIITKESRNKKLTEITTKEVREQQLSQLTDTEKNKLYSILDTSINKKKEGIELDYYNSEQCNKVIDYSIGHLYSRKSVLKGNQVLAECISQGLGHIHLDQLKEEIQKHSELISIQESKGNKYLDDEITTKTGLQIEYNSVELVNQGKDTCSPINKKYKPFNDKKTLRLEAEGKLNLTEQRKVIEDILTSKDKYISLRGVAGSGKTTSLTELNNGLKNKINNIVFLSPQTGGKEVLKTEGFKNSQTVASFIMKQNDPSNKIKNGLIIVDEAGLLSNVDGSNIINAAEKYNARVLFVGDVDQHKSVAAGDYLRILETHSKIEKLELSKIFRQTNKEYLKAAEKLSQGQIDEAILKFDNLGWVNEGTGKYINNSVDDYLKFTEDGKKLDDCIFVTPTHDEADKITSTLREKLKDLNVIDKNNPHTKEIFKSTNWTAEQKKSTKNYVPEQRILITNDHDNFKKNEILTVDKIITDDKKRNRILTTSGKLLKITEYSKFEIGETKNIELSHGDKIMTRLNDGDIYNGKTHIIKNIDSHGNITTERGDKISKDYSSIQYGYVSTSHKSQGDSAKSVVVAAENIRRDALYVAGTRGKQECRIHIPDKEQLYMQAGLLTKRSAALDIINRDNTTKKKIKKKVANRNNRNNKRNIINRKKFWRTLNVKISKAKNVLSKYIEEYKEVETKRKDKAIANNVDNSKSKKYHIDLEKTMQQNKASINSITKEKGLNIDF